MRLNEVNFENGLPVEGYGPGFFRVGGQLIHGDCLILPGGVQDWGGYDDAAPLLAARGKIDVLFMGTGAEIAHLPASLRAKLEEAGLGIEAMSSPAACRTYNVLLSEGRRVGAALRALPRPA
ncbi:Mth938-like domain-containing protein [Profundibacterium mesophilum]|uniref:Mth938-like domain-containing protein n=1 Tax=Profundibacterium mesophilum KAUST100406-0324 TaxID=1037889 RepID=A0A921TCF3_9RHOB|nr:Mth938-like domain-containing protein [Profundibacterium mesophilum]KAF0674817.1 hypothetical protein PMES_02893 [Profundibacterium mesophilum KAUST100406-0324]